MKRAIAEDVSDTEKKDIVRNNSNKNQPNRLIRLYPMSRAKKNPKIEDAVCIYENCTNDFCHPWLCIRWDPRAILSINIHGSTSTTTSTYLDVECEAVIKKNWLISGHKYFQCSDIALACMLVDNNLPNELILLIIEFATLVHAVENEWHILKKLKTS
jgi:hypothetical protein